MEIKLKAWVVMTKDRSLIAKGVPRNRYLVKVSDSSDKKRILTYSSEKIAFANSHNGVGFYGMVDDRLLEPVQVEITYREIV